MSKNNEQMNKFKEELDNAIVSLNKMLTVWLDLTNEPEDEILENNYPFPLSLDEQIAEIEVWRDSVASFLKETN